MQILFYFYLLLSVLNIRSISTRVIDWIVLTLNRIFTYMFNCKLIVIKSPIYYLSSCCILFSFSEGYFKRISLCTNKPISHVVYICNLVNPYSYVSRYRFWLLIMIARKSERNHISIHLKFAFQQSINIRSWIRIFTKW